jgi:hypothetical protein
LVGPVDVKVNGLWEEIAEGFNLPEEGKRSSHMS